MRAKKQKKIEDEKRCPECGSKELVRSDEEVYCRKCGYVLE